MPRVKTWRELGVVEVAPKKADPVAVPTGETTMFPGTRVKTTLPLTIRHPSFTVGTAVTVIFAIAALKDKDSRQVTERSTQHKDEVENEKRVG